MVLYVGAQLRHRRADPARAETYVEPLLQSELEGPLCWSSEQLLLQTYRLSQDFRYI